VSPGIRGSSGILLIYLSSSHLNLSVVHPVRFLMFWGKALKSLGPLIGSDENLIFLMEHGVDGDIDGILHSRPRRVFW